MSYLDLAATLVKRLEACRLTGYPDSGGVPTDGYGNTGPAVKIGRVITQEIADHDLAANLATADHRLRDVIHPLAIPQLHEHEMAALVSFVFNVGANPTWTIWKDINAGNLADVPTQMARFDKATVKGKLVDVPGLDHRRAAEIAYWKTADVEQAAAVIAAAPVAAPPSGYTRAIPTPPTPVAAPPMAGASLITKCATALAGCAAGAGTLGSQVHDIVSPHAGESHVFASIAVGASGLVVAAAIVGLLISGHQAAARTV